MNIQRIHPEQLFRYDGMAQVIAVTGASKIIHVSGQVAMDKDMNLAAGDHCAQAAKAFENLKIALAAAGATFNNLVTTTVYVKNIGPEALEAIGKAMHTAFDGKPIPDHATTWIGVVELGSPEVLLEVSAVAMT